ncbi:DUF5837 family cyanobactin class RiPP [Phormidium nigroviride]
MDKKNLMPQAAQPVNRTTTGQLPDVLAELSEEALQQPDGNYSSASVLPTIWSETCGKPGDTTGCYCSYDGDDAE